MPFDENNQEYNQKEISERTSAFVYADGTQIDIDMPGKGTVQLDLNIHCAICFRSFQSNEKMKRWKSCNHQFHADCLGGFLWLTGHTANQEMGCPLCNRLKRLPQKVKQRPAKPVQFAFESTQPRDDVKEPSTVSQRSDPNTFYFKQEAKPAKEARRARTPPRAPNQQMNNAPNQPMKQEGGCNNQQVHAGYIGGNVIYNQYGKR